MNEIVYRHIERCTMTTHPPLTHDEHKAAEASFYGLPLDPKWSRHAQEIYLGILRVTNGRTSNPAAQREP